MKTAVMTAAEQPAVLRAGLNDYLELTKPRIAVMALMTVAVGYMLGAAPELRKPAPSGFGG